MADGGGGGGGGYDISQSTSESATTASRAGGSTFNVGGGIKIPQWVWAVAALGFTHLAIVRSAQRPADSESRGLQRLADLVLAQLRLMVPQREQPVRAAQVAALVASLARRLGANPPGTRVMAPEWAA